MSDGRPIRKPLGRGRGIPVNAEGPWSRSKKLDETQDVRPPKKQGDGFELSESSFPPLPGAATISDQFDSVEDTAQSPNLNGVGKPESIHNGNPENTNVDTENDDSKGKPDSIPNGNPENPNVETERDTIKVDITNSNLSPFATEFVPKAANMNPEAEDFIPTSYSGNYDETNNNQSPLTSSFNVNDTPAILADLEETVNFCYSKLMETPASYDELMGVVTPHFIKYMSNKTLPNEIVRTLFGYAITDTRFAYFAVKILIHLVKVTSTEEVNVLRDTLLRHAQEEVQNIQNVRLPNPDVNCVIDVLPLLMFLSELYIQLEVGGSRLAPIGIAIVEILIKLLNTAHILLNERLRVIVNILKLTGLSLDQDNPIFLDRLFTELSLILDDHKSKVDDHTSQILHDIIILRNLRWGLLEPEDYLQNDTNMPVSPNGNQVFQPQTNNYDPSFDSNMGYASGVFYGPDGVPIDYEEQLFLEVETNNLNQLQLDQGEPSPTSVEGFDEGFDEAYEEFLKTVPGHSSKNC